MCSVCPGCALANLIEGNSSKSVYNVPIKAPFQVLHTNVYTAGMHSGLKGSTSYLIGCCEMCSFGILEHVTGATESTIAFTIMTMQLRFDFCHTVDLDKDSKFFSICRESLDLLKINWHILLGDNHNPMLVKWLCPHSSEVQNKIFMGHQILSCHVPVVRSFFISWNMLLSS
jgi:hypothetical protein